MQKLMESNYYLTYNPMDLFNYQEARTKTKRKLGKLETLVRMIIEEEPKFLELKHQNKLVRHVWSNYKDYPCDSITRTMRRIRAEGLDTAENQKFRANQEVAHREYFKV